MLALSLKNFPSFYLKYKSASYKKFLSWKEVLIFQPRQVVEYNQFKYPMERSWNQIIYSIRKEW